MVGTRAAQALGRSTRWVVGAAMAVALAGCSAAATSATSAAPATSATSAGGAAVDLAGTSLGQVLVDAAGRTLYMFDKDTQGGASTCYDQCASAWPPLLTEGTPTAGAGLDASALGTAARTDGTTQVTYHGWPLYYWAQDAAAGDVKGEGVNNVWWVLGSDGQPIHG